MSDQLTLFAEGSLARTSARQEQSLALVVHDLACGQSSTDWFASYDLNTCSWKTSQKCFIEGLSAYSETWPEVGTMQNGNVFPAQTLARPMSDKDSGLLPTPTRSMGYRGWGFSLTTKRRYCARIIRTVHQFGWRPPVDLLEWAMGFPISWTDVSEPKA